MVELRWTVDHHNEAGSQMPVSFARDLHMQGKALKTGIPAQPVSFRYPSELRLKGDTTECLSKTFQTNDVEASLSLIPYRTSYDGRVSKVLVGSDPTRELSMLESTNTNVASWGNLPILIYYRPLSEKFAILDKDALKIIEQTVLIDGHRCVRISDGNCRVCLDRDRKLIPIAFQHFRRNGDVTLDATIEYTPHGTLHFAPKHFVVKRYLEPSKPAETITGDIVETHWGQSAH
jgi:hypothetical protein